MAEKMKTLFVLDFSSGKCKTRLVPSKFEMEQVEKVIQEAGFRLQDVEWMTTFNNTVEEF
jgi:hypothetical protein